MQRSQSGFHLEEKVEWWDGFKWRPSLRIIEFSGMKVRLASPEEEPITNQDFRKEWWPLARIRKSGITFNKGYAL